MSVPTTEVLSARAGRILEACGATIVDGEQSARTPITGGSLGPAGSSGDVSDAVDRAVTAFATWRETPGPARGATVRRLGELLRDHKDELGELVSIETGKIRSEGLGEVQEMIDICDFAVGLSRQLHGLTIASERPGPPHDGAVAPARPVGVITAFNFPVAVWAWNAALALVCGDPVIWKPSDKTPLTAIACQRAVRAGGRRTACAGSISTRSCSAARDVGAALVANTAVPIVSATGSTAMGRQVRRRPSPGASAARSSNWAATTRRSSRHRPTSTWPLRGIMFAAAGTAGQRCTRCGG